MIFGEKSTFAIEVNVEHKSNKGLMRLWLKDNPIGTYKRKGGFIHAVFDFYFVLDNRYKLYEKCFDKMATEEINDYVMAEDLIWSENKLDLDEAERRKIYYRHLGDQFDGQCSFLSIIQGDIIKWIVWNYRSKKNEFEVFEIDFSSYEAAFSKYVEWFNLTLSKFHPIYKIRGKT